MTVPRNPLVEQILSGSNRQLALMAAQGLLPLPPEEIVSVQVDLVESGDEEVARQARESLLSLDPRVGGEVLSRAAGQKELAWFARHSADESVLRTIVRRRDVEPIILDSIAGRAGADLQEAILLRQDLIVERPEILEALERNAELSNFASRRIREYREHLLRDRRPVAESPAPQGLERTAPAPEIGRPVATPAPREEEEEEAEWARDLNEAQVRLLPVPDRLKLARGASATLRGILIRDRNPQVAMAVLKDNPIGDKEVEQFAKSRAVIDDVLEEIARRREWVRKYPIAKALVYNPRTPPGIAMKLLPQLSIRDLRDLRRDRNVAAAIRKRATQLYRMKSQ